MEEPKGPSELYLPSLASMLLRRIENEIGTSNDLTEVELFRKLALLDQLKSINAATEKMIAQLRAPLEQQALSRFEQLGINNFNIDGRTVYLHREWWVKAKTTPEDAIRALKACPETEVFVKETYNTQMLSAYFRERRLALEEYPAVDASEFSKIFQGGPTRIFPTRELETALDFSEKISVRSRQGGK